MTDHKKQILLVDDFKDNLDVYDYFLTKWGFQVILATDGQMALDKANQFRPDLIIMDLSLPVISGWDAIRHLKTHEATKHIPIVALTAYPLLSGEAVGCEGCLTKPCRPAVILAEIERVLEAKDRNASQRPGRLPV